MVAASSANPYVIAILASLGGLAALIAALQTFPAVKAARAAKVTSDRVTGVQLSMSSLEAALARADLDRERLESRIDDLVAEMERRDEVCKGQIAALSAQVRALGAVPQMNGGVG